MNTNYGVTSQYSSAVDIVSNTCICTVPIWIGWPILNDKYFQAYRQAGWTSQMNKRQTNREPTTEDSNHNHINVGQVVLI